jgi:ATP-dependent Lon protease
MATSRKRKSASLRREEIEFGEDALRRIIRDYTREAGVRNLERQIGSVCRKVITKVAEGQAETIVVTEDDVPEYLGKPRFFSEIAERTEIPGVATGLVVTPVGGDITFVEATRMKGKGRFTITGQLGDVMKESAQAALSYIRAKAGELDIDEDSFSESDIHVHVPAGAIPKDGPSAGVTMATALVSLFSGRPVRSDLAMTGEVTLRGQVLPVGGIKQKVLAAYQAGLDTVILPKRNEVDLDDLPQEARDKMHFILVDKVDQVIASALRDGHDE